MESTSQPAFISTSVATMSQEATRSLKRELRSRIRAALCTLPQKAIAHQSEDVINRFTATPIYQTASSLALYSSMPREFDTTALLTRAFEDRKRVFLPRVVSKKEHKMVMLECYSVADRNSWTANSWNIREPPVDGRLQTPEDMAVDLVVVPGVAFDKNGGRCGHGMGFYDRYLSNYAGSGRKMPQLVALSLDVQMVDEVVVSEDDYRIDQVIYFDKTEAE